MSKRLHRIIVERQDGSTCTSPAITVELAAAVVNALHALPSLPARIISIPNDDLVGYADRGPVMPLDEAMKCRQPDDDITRLLGRRD